MLCTSTCIFWGLCNLSYPNRFLHASRSCSQFFGTCLPPHLQRQECPLRSSHLEILDFLPLSNVDYSGGIITTDWYNEGTASNESLKITIRFLTNEIRADGLRIIVHKRLCNQQQNCTVKKISSTLEHELRVAILKKAVLYEKNTKKKKTKLGIRRKKSKVLSYFRHGIGLDSSCVVRPVRPVVSVSPCLFCLISY